MKKLSGFSLMEMMIVLLIVSIIAGATAPMINKKLMTAASEKSPWVWIGQNNDIGYNLLGKNITAAIGTINLPGGIPSRPPRLYVHTEDARMNPLLSFQGPNSIRWDMTIAKNSLYLSNFLPNSDDEIPERSLSIGPGALTTGNDAIALGSNTNGAGKNSIAIGKESTTFNDMTLEGANSAIALGANSKAIGEYGIAIGGGNSSNSTSTRSWNSSSIAIGRGTDALGENSIAMGYNAAAGTEENQSALSAIAIGHNSQATGEYGIAIGGGNTSGPTQTRSWNSSSIAIGRGTDALAQNSIAIGYNAAAAAYDDDNNELPTQPMNAIAIGHGAKATASSSLAIGSSGSFTVGNTTYPKNAPLAEHNCSVAIGPGAVTNASNQIVLGDTNTTVYIPGNLYVGGKTLLGTRNLPSNTASNVFIRFSKNEEALTQLRADDVGDNNIYVKLNSGYPVTVGEEYDYTTSSDRRLKNVGKAFKGGLEEIKKLEVFNYTFKKDKSKTPRVGVMAQDLEKIFPSAVAKGEDGFLRIRMEDMFYALVNAVKELDAKIDILAQKQKKIDELEDKVSKLEKRLVELEKKVK